MILFKLFDAKVMCICRANVLYVQQKETITMTVVYGRSLSLYYLRPHYILDANLTSTRVSLQEDGRIIRNTSVITAASPSICV